MNTIRWFSLWLVFFVVWFTWRGLMKFSHPSFELMIINKLIWWNDSLSYFFVFFFFINHLPTFIKRLEWQKILHLQIEFDELECIVDCVNIRKWWCDLSFCEFFFWRDDKYFNNVDISAFYKYFLDNRLI